MSFPSFGDTQPSCHPVASKKHSSNHLVLSAEVQGTARGRKEGRKKSAPLSPLGMAHGRGPVCHRKAAEPSPISSSVVTSGPTVPARGSERVA